MHNGEYVPMKSKMNLPCLYTQVYTNKYTTKMIVHIHSKNIDQSIHTHSDDNN